MTKKIRIGWIDIARGIGILLVVYGHALSAGELRAVIYSFHMPLFFLLSGLVFRYKLDESFVEFVKKNAKNILLPYAFFALLSFILWYVTKHPSVASALFQFGSIFYGNGNYNLLQFNNILWFLPCLFTVRLGFYLLTRKIQDPRKILLVMLGISLIGYGYSLFIGFIKLPFGIETALDSMAFFGVGYLLTLIPKNLQQKIPRFAIFLTPFLLLVCVVVALMNFSMYGVQIDLRKDILNNYLLFSIAAFAGTFGVLLLSILIKHNVVFEYLGKQSLVIFAWHLVAFPYVSKLLGVLQVKPILAKAPLFVSPIVWSITSICIVLLIAIPIQMTIRHLKGLRTKE